MGNRTYELLHDPLLGLSLKSLLDSNEFGDVGVNANYLPQASNSVISSSLACLGMFPNLHLSISPVKHYLSLHQRPHLSSSRYELALGIIILFVSRQISPFLTKWSICVLRMSIWRYYHAFRTFSTGSTTKVSGGCMPSTEC